MKIFSSKQSRFFIKPICAAVLLAVAAQNVQANPTGASVVNGQASFATSGNTLTVTNTPGAIINWQGFSIGTNEITRFVQQSAASSVLNRVVSSNSSNILGSLQSNGRVFLVNPNGIIFGAGATVDVAGLVATTLNISNADFIAGRNRFTQIPGAQNISNAGNITAQGDGQSGGQIYLIAPNVENSGVINAPNGEILLAAGHSVELVDSSEPSLRVNITAPAGDATNVGQLVASSGSLGLFGTMVRNSGTVSADSATLQGGKIVFKASQRAEISGTVSANGTTGGTIEALGNQVGIMDGATISADGTQGGGTILIGGDYQGKNPDVPNATVTYVATTASISADATDNGDGGKVIVWADDTTRAYGDISARGGANGGDGGFVETSGKNHLDVAGISVDTRASQGATGDWLLDPTDIQLIAGVGTDNYGGGSFSGDPYMLSGGAGSATIYSDNIKTALATTHVILTTNSGGTGNITFTAGTYDLSPTNSATNSLTLLAYGGGASSGNISLPNGTIVNMQHGSLMMVAGWDGASTISPVSTPGFGSIQMVNSQLYIRSGAYVAPTHLAILKSGNGISLTNSSIDAFGQIRLEAASGDIIVNGSSPMIQAYGASMAMVAKGGNITIGGDNLETTINGWGTSLLAYGNLTVDNTHLYHSGSGNDVFAAGWDGISSETNPTVVSAQGDLTIQNSYFSSLGNTIIKSGGDFSFVVTNGSSFPSFNYGPPINVAVASPELYAGGTLNIVVGDDLTIGTIGDSVNEQSVAIRSSGNQTVTLTGANSDLLVTASSGTGYGGMARLYSSGSQTIDFTANGTHAITLTGGSGANTSAGANATIEAIGTQQILNSGAGTLAISLTGGDVTDNTLSSTKDSVTICTSCATHNSASIRSTGAQTINATTITLQGGSGGNGNDAEIESKSGQNITTTGAISLTGGSSGGLYVSAYNETVGNEAGIHADGTQTISAASITLAGGTGASTLGGAFLSGKTSQSITTTGNLTMTGGAGNVSGMYGLGTPAIIGEENGANITLNIGGTLSMTGGSGSTSGALIGSAQGTPSVAITAGNITMNAGSSTSRMGVLTGGPAGSLTMTASGGIGQDAASFINTNTLSATASSAAINLAGANLVNTVNSLSAYGGITYNSAQTVHIGSATSSMGGTLSFMTTGSGNNLFLGTASGTIVNLTSAGGIYDDNGSGTNNITATTSSTLISTGATLGQLGVSMDVNTPNITATVSGSYGGISIRSASATAPATIALTDSATVTPQGVSFSHSGANPLVLDGNKSFTAGSGSVTISSSNDLTYSGASISSTGTTKLGAAGALNVNSNLSVSGGLAMNAATINLTGAGVSASTDANATASGDIRLNNGGYIQAINDVYLVLAGSASTLYLNDTAGLTPSHILTDALTTTHLDFLARSSGGVVIDGIETTSTAVGGSGFFSGSTSTPAVQGSGLMVTYGLASTSTTVNSIVNEIVVIPPATTSGNTIITEAAPTTETAAATEEKKKEEAVVVADGSTPVAEGTSTASLPVCK